MRQDEPPLAEFSQCHAGILAGLERFADLPALIAAAARARAVAAQTLVLFENAVLAHHGDEEAELFPAVLRWAAPGEEQAHVEAMVQQLTSEHRRIEKLWKQHRAVLEAAARGKPADLAKEAATDLVQAYVAHATFEEQVFLPLARTILGRDGDHLSSLGMSLHMRHAPQIPGYI
jgi:hypothetical protein